MNIIPNPVKLIVTAASFSSALFVLPAVQAADIEGASDHRLVARVADSEILSYTYRELEQVAIPTGPVERVRDTETRKSTWNYAKAEKVEGKHWSIVYGMPEDSSTLHIFRSYTKTLEEAGFKILYSASGKELDDENGFTFFARNEILNHNKLSTTKPRSPKEANFHYLAAEINHAEHGRVVVAVSTFNAVRRSSGEVIGSFGGKPFASV
jgi:hypothetical protein